MWRLWVGVAFLTWFAFGYYVGLWNAQRRRRLQAVLDVFLRYPDTNLYGLDISRMAFQPAAAIYPELARLEQDGTICSTWQDGPVEGPRRRVYWLNPNRPSVAEITIDLEEHDHDRPA